MIQSAVVIHHGGIAFVDILRGEIQHMVMKPMGTHGLPPIAANGVNATIIVRSASLRIGATDPDRHVRPGSSASDNHSIDPDKKRHECNRRFQPDYDRYARG